METWTYGLGWACPSGAYKVPWVLQGEGEDLGSQLQAADITAGEPRQEPEEVAHGPHSQKRGEDVARRLFMVSSYSDVWFMT